jgi:hypothetical protein
MVSAVVRTASTSGDPDKNNGRVSELGGRRRVGWMEPRLQKGGAAGGAVADEASHAGGARSPERTPEPSLMPLPKLFFSFKKKKCNARASREAREEEEKSAARTSF